MKEELEKLDMKTIESKGHIDFKYIKYAASREDLRKQWQEIRRLQRQNKVLTIEFYYAMFKKKKVSLKQLNQFMMNEERKQLENDMKNTTIKSVMSSYDLIKYL